MFEIGEDFEEEGEDLEPPEVAEKKRIRENRQIFRLPDHTGPMPLIAQQIRLSLFR